MWLYTSCKPHNKSAEITKQVLVCRQNMALSLSLSRRKVGRISNMFLLLLCQFQFLLKSSNFVMEVSSTFAPHPPIKVVDHNNFNAAQIPTVWSAKCYQVPNAVKSGFLNASKVIALFSYSDCCTRHLV